MTQRQRIKRIPFGSPDAGWCKVYRIDPETGEKVYVRTEQPWHAAKQDCPNGSIERYIGTKWAQPNDPVAFEAGRSN